MRYGRYVYVCNGNLCYCCFYKCIVLLAVQGKISRDILLTGIGGVRACGRALSSIPSGLASANSHSELVGLGLYTVNTPPP